MATDVKAPQSELIAQLTAFFGRDVARRATAPLRTGVEIAVHLDGREAISLTKQEDRVVFLEKAPKKPDITVHVTSAAVERLCATQTEDVGEVGVEILKLMASGDETSKIKAKLHIGTFDLLRNGYLGILPLGGGTVMKFLASKGFTSMGKIKEAISHLRN